MSFKKIAKREYQELVDSNYGGLVRGDIVLTNCHSSLIAKAIRLKGRKDSGECHVNHAELYIGSGLDIAAELTINIHPIKKFFSGKHDIYVFRNIKLTKEQRNQIVADSFVFHGKLYDILGIFGQALSFLTRIAIFSKLVNSKGLLYCSELVSKVYKQSTDSFLENKDYQTITPDDIYDFCIQNSNVWVCVFELIKD